MTNSEPRILIVDIETAPNLGWVWGKWQQNVIDFEKHWYLLCFAWKWYGESKTHFIGLPDFEGYEKDMEDDLGVAQKLHELFEEADVIIAHNGDQFDIKKSNARFLFHGMSPPSHYKTIDTKKVAKRYFRFDSNSLNDLGKYLNLGAKVSHSGFALWRGCMTGDRASWKTMKEYNIQDIDLLEDLYEVFKPWMTNHPNMGFFYDDIVCPNCASTELQKRGYQKTKTEVYQRFQCQTCGAWSRSKTHVKDAKKPKLTN